MTPTERAAHAELLERAGRSRIQGGQFGDIFKAACRAGAAALRAPAPDQGARQCVYPLCGGKPQPDPPPTFTATTLAPAIDSGARQEVIAELQRIARFIRAPNNIWSEDAVDECARVLENRIRDLQRLPPDAAYQAAQTATTGKDGD